MEILYVGLLPPGLRFLDELDGVFEGRRFGGICELYFDFSLLLDCALIVAPRASRQHLLLMTAPTLGCWVPVTSGATPLCVITLHHLTKLLLFHFPSTT